MLPQTVELLRWVSSGARTYDETIAAWRTSCPHLAVWDDAVTDGLVQVVPDPGGGYLVSLTQAGKATLEGVRVEPRPVAPGG